MDSFLNAIQSSDIGTFKNLVNSVNDIQNGFSLAKCDLHEDIDDETLPTSDLSLLHVAAYYNSLECFQYLYKEKQLPLRLQSQKGYLPLHYACYNGSTEVALYILNEDPEAPANQDKKKLSFLYCAVLGHDKTIVEELLKKGDKLSSPLNDEYTIILKAIGLHNTEILSILFPLRNKDYESIYHNDRSSYSMAAVLSHDVHALELVYCKEDLNHTLIIRSKFISLISTITEVDQRHEFKDILLKILDDAKDTCIEPPEELQFQSGVCHWACNYGDVDVARKMLQTKDVKINRFNMEHRTGAFKLIERKNSQTIEMLRLLIENGFDVNARYDEKCPTLLEGFLVAISKNYEAIKFLVDSGADVNAFHSKATKMDGQPITLYEFVKEKEDKKIKEIFNI